MTNQDLEPLQVSANHRFLMTRNGEPFFWLADTAWELFHRLTFKEAEWYMDVRCQQGFNVILAVILSEFDGLNTPNAYGDCPLLDNDPTQPNKSYFRYVDEIVRLAAAKGLYVGLLPTWGDKVVRMWGVGPVILNAENARVYAEWLARRYGDFTNIVWVLGGDRPARGFEPVWEAMAHGIRAGTSQKPVITFHPMGQQGSSGYFPTADWLDFNLWQSGHARTDFPNWEMIAHDYALDPTKPVIDGEPNYEDHPIDPFSRKWQPENGRFTDYDVRKQAYRAVFAGACGHTYGHHSVWQFYSPERPPINDPVFYWREAVYRPGARQLIHLKQLMLSQEYRERIPDQSLIVSEQGDASAHVRATRSAAGRYAFIYIPKPKQEIVVDLGKLSGRVIAHWHDPRTGETERIGEFGRRGVQEFTTPLGGPDWVLTLDDLNAQ